MTKLQSDAARAARFICILFMSYVHLHFFQLPGADFEITKIVLVDTFGRSSVPLLSVLSGYFMVGYFAKRSYATASLSRARSLLVPMVIWNLVASAMLGFSYPLWDAIFAATGTPKLIYLAFLRDLFVMSLLTPALAVFARKAPLLLAGAVFAYYVSGWSNVVILRPQIAFFFVAGVLVAIYPQPLPRRSGLLGLAGVAAAIVWQLARPDLSGFYFDNLFLRPVTAFAFWVAALWIAANAPKIARFEAAAFPFFLVHGIAFLAVGSLYSDVPALHTVPAYYTIWLLTPPVIYGLVYKAWPATGRVGRALAA